MRHERRNRIDGYRARARRGVHAGPSASKSRVVVRRSTHVRPRSPPAPAPSPASARHRRRPRRPRRCPSYRRQRLWVATRRHPRARSPPRQTWPEERPSCELASREASFPMYPLATARHLSVRRRAWRRARQLCTPRRRRGDVSLGLVRDGRPRNGGRGPHFQTSYPYRSRFSETLQVTSAHFRDENEKFFPGRLTTPRVACRCSPAPRASARDRLSWTLWRQILAPIRRSRWSTNPAPGATLGLSPGGGATSLVPRARGDSRGRIASSRDARAAVESLGSRLVAAGWRDVQSSWGPTARAGPSAR